MATNESWQSNVPTIEATVKSTGTGIDQFRPVWWLPEGHSQTLWRKFGPAAQVEQRRQRIELADGDFMDLDWSGPQPGSENIDTPILLIVHGLCGCSQSSYVLSLQSLLSENQLSSVALNFRGCSGAVNRLAKAYHSGISDDLNTIVDTIRDQYPEHNISIVGYSLGANVLLKWLGEGRDYGSIKNATAVSTPFSLGYCSRAMLEGLSSMYGRYFVRRLKQDFLLKARHFEDQGHGEELEKLRSLGDLRNVKTIWQFDDVVTAPLHGFDSAEHYYQQSSSARFLAGISTPTLLIQSRNDPLIPEAALPAREQLPDSVSFHLNDQGGHVGFIAGYRDHWLDQRIMNFALA